MGAPQSSSVFEAAHGGFSDDLPDSPRGYARRLIRYIRSDSTVQARVREHFGSAPSLEAIAALRAEHARSAEQRRLAAARAELAAVEAEAAREAEAAEERRAWQPPEPKALPGPLRPLAKETIKDAAWSTSALIAAVAADFGLTAADITGRARARQVVRVRNLIAALLTARGLSSPRIARAIRRDDHTTVLHALRMFRSRDLAEDDIAAAWAKWSAKA